MAFVHVSDSTFFANSVFQGAYKLSDSWVGGVGGAVALMHIRGYVQIDRCTFDVNQAIQEGGALHMRACYVSIGSSTFRKNLSKSSGGALSAYIHPAFHTEGICYTPGMLIKQASSNAEFPFTVEETEHMVFSKRELVGRAWGTQRSDGSEALGMAGSIELSNCKFTGNYAAAEGGAVLLNFMLPHKEITPVHGIVGC